MRRRLTKLHPAILLAILSSLLFLTLSSTRLTVQGLYYDELHQATAAFAYQGKPPLRFATLTLRGLPVMNMQYSGAIKTAIYGIYLRIFGQPFSVISWRLLGILFVSAGLLLFGLILRDKLPFLSLLSFYFFFITDISILLMTRHDYGPVALALSIRLAIIAHWIYSELSDSVPLKNSFWLGLLVGFSIFEKLSSISLFLPFSLLFIFSQRRRTRRHMIASGTGFLIGVLPLILANILNYYKIGGLILDQFQDDQKVYFLKYFLSFSQDFLSLGAGEFVQTFILGKGPNAFSWIEGILLLVSLLTILTFVVLKRPSSDLFRLSVLMVVSYASILLILFFLPSQYTWHHHWVIGTPFQYTAIALFFAGIKDNKDEIRKTGLKLFMGLLTGAFLVLRLFGLFSVEQSLFRGDSSIRWDPSYTLLGEFAAAKGVTAFYIAGDWGVANQIFTYLNGEPGLVFEMDYYNPRVTQVLSVIRGSELSEFYYVVPEPPYFVQKEKTLHILEQIEIRLAPDWQVQPVEDQAATWSAVKVYKFTRTQKD